MKPDKDWCLQAARREGDSEVGAGRLAADPVKPDKHDGELAYLVSDYEPRIFITYKDGEFWATSTTEDYSYVVLPHDDEAGK